MERGRFPFLWIFLFSFSHDDEARANCTASERLLAFQLGFCYWKLGQKDKIRPLYARLPEWFRPHESYDVFAKRKVDTFLAKDEFTLLDELTIQIGTIFSSRLELPFKVSLLRSSPL